MRILATSIVLLSLVLPALAVDPDQVLDDPALEARARALSSELRCLVCQNQSIDDSDAPLARDLRDLLRERLKAGDGDRDVIAFLVDRYGEFILLKPRFDRHTLLLWLSPFVLLGVGIVGVVMGRRKARRSGEQARLSDDEAARLEKLLDG